MHLCIETEVQKNRHICVKIQLSHTNFCQTANFTILFRYDIDVIFIRSYIKHNHEIHPFFDIVIISYNYFRILSSDFFVYLEKFCNSIELTLTMFVGELLKRMIIALMGFPRIALLPLEQLAEAPENL